MKKSTLKKEGEKWVKDGLITEDQLKSILADYTKHDQSYLLVIFAVLLTSIGILIFIFSDWAQVPHLSRIIVMLVFMLLLYLFGNYFYSRESKHDHRSRMIGISFIILGYIIFGATLFLTLYMYNVTLISVWPYMIWSIAGLLLYTIYPNAFLFVIALLITIFAQIMSGLQFSAFHYLIFIIYLFGYFHYVYHRYNSVFHYLFAIGLLIQLLVLSLTELTQYYWFIFFALLVYGFGNIIPKDSLKKTFGFISIVTILLFKLYETISIQEEYFMNEIKFHTSFFILWAIAFIIIFIIQWKVNKVELMNLLLFIPFFFLSYAYIYIIISMFIFSIYWLIIGFLKEKDENITVGMISFLISTFTVFIQFAWDTLNKSLFFLIAGFLLFVISSLFERKRRKTKKETM